MSHYPSIKKISRLINDQTPITFLEYAVFKGSEEDPFKYMIIDCEKVILDQVESFIFEIVQFDSSGKPLRKGTYEYKESINEKQTKFVIKDKIQIDNECSSINISLTKLKTATNFWESGKWLTDTSAKENVTEVHKISEIRLRYPVMISALIILIFALFAGLFFYFINMLV